MDKEWSIEFWQIADGWEELPDHYTRLDVTSQFQEMVLYQVSCGNSSSLFYSIMLEIHSVPNGPWNLKKRSQNLVEKKFKRIFVMNHISRSLLCSSFISVMEKTFMNLLSYTNSLISMLRFRAITLFNCNAIFFYRFAKGYRYHVCVCLSICLSVHLSRSWAKLYLPATIYMSNHWYWWAYNFFYNSIIF